MTPAEHRAAAEDMLATAETYPTNVLARADLISRATVHALLALGPLTVDYHVTAYGGGASGGGRSPADSEEPKPTPRKRAARKTTTTKETSK